MLIKFLETLQTFIGTGISVFVVVILFLITQKLLKTKTNTKRKSTSLWKQVILITLAIIGVIIIVLTLPIDNSTQNSILTVIGIILSAAITLSSTTFLGNLFASFMNRSVDSYDIGDFVKIGDEFGRITGMDLFHLEIQTEDRGLVTFPHLHVATNPIKVVRNSGTIISALVSLGYDVNRKTVTPCLKAAATEAGLKDPFVYITELGDFSIVYKIHGMLEDVSKLLTVKSALHAAMLDKLHEAKIEIVSPTFMNQRQVNETVFIPKKSRVKTGIIAPEKLPEEMIFDKAEQAETIEKKKEKVQEIITQIEEAKVVIKELKDDAEKEKVKQRITKLEDIKKRIETRIIDDEEKLKED